MSELRHLRVFFVGQSSPWWFLATEEAELERAIRHEDPWVVLTDFAGVRNHLRLEEIARFHVWDPAKAPDDYAFQRRIRAFYREQHPDYDDDEEPWRRSA